MERWWHLSETISRVTFWLHLTRWPLEVEDSWLAALLVCGKSEWSLEAWPWVVTLSPMFTERFNTIVGSPNSDVWVTATSTNRVTQFHSSRSEFHWFNLSHGNCRGKGDNPALLPGNLLLASGVAIYGLVTQVIIQRLWLKFKFKNWWCWSYSLMMIPNSWLWPGLAVPLDTSLTTEESSFHRFWLLASVTSFSKSSPKSLNLRTVDCKFAVALSL